MEKTQPKKRLWVVLLLAVVVILLLLAYYLWQNGSLAWKLPGLLGGTPSYQAVFLSNGQVYFGKASSLNAKYVTLRDVYYLQVSQTLQPSSGQQAQSLSLAKLGTAELHKPKDEMKINRDHVIFVEDLDEDSQVVQAIERYKEGQQ